MIMVIALVVHGIPWATPSIQHTPKVDWSSSAHQPNPAVSTPGCHDAFLPFLTHQEPAAFVTRLSTSGAITSGFPVLVVAT
jgi:hypothetical protein